MSDAVAGSGDAHFGLSEETAAVPCGQFLGWRRFGRYVRLAPSSRFLATLVDLRGASLSRFDSVLCGMLAVVSG